MSRVIKVVLVIVFAALFLILIYQQIEIENLKPSQSQPTTTPTMPSTPTYSPTPTLTPNIPSGFTEVSSTIVATQLSVSQQNANLIISGNITNNSADTLNNLGLHVCSYGYPFYQTTAETILDTIIPIASGTINSTNHTLTTLSLHETITVHIIIPASYASRTVTLYGNEVTVVQAS